MSTVTLLPQRGQCTRSPCLCRKTVFVVEEYRREAVDPNELCLCNHSWLMHIPVLSTERGVCPSTHCGGFFPLTNSTGLCVCGAAYGDHAPRVLASSELTAELASETDANGPAAALARTPPRLAYAGLIQPWNRPEGLPTAAADRERRVAAERHRSVSNSRVQRPSTPTSGNNTRIQRASTPSTSSGSSHTRPPSTPSTPTLDPSEPLRLNCALWPFVVKKPSRYPVPDLSFKVRALGEVMDCLTAHNLVFSVAIDHGEQHPWKPIHRALSEQLRTNGYSLKFNDDDLGVQFTRLSWDILAQKKPNKKGKSVKYLFEPGLAGPASFTVEFLSDQAFDPEMENRNNDHRFIMIGPRLEHIKGPISDGLDTQSPHACFPWRLFTPYDWGTKGINIECIEGKCPSPESPVPVVGVRRPRSPSPTPLARNTRQRQGSLSSDSRISELEANSENDAVQEDLPEINELPKLEVLELQRWQFSIRSHATGYFDLGAPTVKEASAAFIHLLQSLLAGTAANQYRSELLGSHCAISGSEALLNFVPRPFRIGNTMNYSVGDGPAQAIYQGALDTRINSDRWLDINGGFYRTLNFFPPAALVRKDTLKEFEIDGIMTGMVMVQLLVEPYPVNPFLVYAALFPGPESLEYLLDPLIEDEDYKRDYLRAVIPDRETRMTLVELFKLRKDQTFPVHKAINHILLRRAFEDPIGAPATFFSSPRDDDQHKNIRNQLFNLLLTGHHEPWKHPHFVAFARGLRLKLCNVPAFVRSPAIVDVPEDIYVFGIHLVLTLWNNRITTPNDIIGRLQYQLVNPSSKPEAILFGELFRTRLVRWLRGKGHPQELVGTIISTDTHERSINSLKITRAEMFWKAISDLNVLPADGQHWDIKVVITFNPYLEADTNHVPLKISVCFKTIYVTVGRGVINLLVEPGRIYDTKDTRFDIWFHTMISHATKEYTRP